MIRADTSLVYPQIESGAASSNDGLIKMFSFSRSFTKSPEIDPERDLFRNIARRKVYGSNVMARNRPFKLT